MNILVTLDSNYLHQLMVMLKSIEVTNPNQNLTVYIIHTKLSDFHLALLKNEFKDINFISIIPDERIFDKAHFTKRISKETYYRLLMCKYLPDSVERVLYLDPDIVVLKNLEELYNCDFAGNCFIGAGHTRGIVEKFNKLRLNMSKNSQYINAGVLMVNLKEYRKIFSMDKISELINKKGVLLFQADQDVINCLYHEKTIYVNAEIYNLDEHTYKIKKLSAKDIDDSTVIIHYDGKNKPWLDNYDGSMKQYYDYFEDMLYADKTEISLPIAN